MRAAMTLGLLILLGIVAYGAHVGPFGSRTVYAATLERIMTRLRTDPELRVRLDAKLQQNCAAPVLPHVLCREAYYTAGFELAQKGVARLDREAATRRVVLLSGFLSSVDETSCGALGRKDGAATASFRAAFERQPPERMRDWEDLVVRAVTAELRGTPGEPLDERQIEAAQSEFVRGLDSEARGRMMVMNIVKQNDRSMSDKDVCWLGRTVYGRVAEMPEPYRGTMAMYITRD